MRDSDVVELAGLFLTLGEREPFEPEGDGDRAPTDVALRLHLATGYTLDQLGATLDALDTLFTAGFVAAEARAAEQPVESVLERLVGDWADLGLTWTVVAVDVGSISLRGIYRRSGEWASKHKTATIWVISGATALAPVVGIHVAAIGVGVWVAGGAVQLLGHTHDRRLKKLRLAESQHGGKPEPQIEAEAVEGHESQPVEAAARPTVHHYRVGLSGPDDARAAFVARVKRIEGVEQQSRLLTGGPEAGRSVYLWSASALDREQCEALAAEAGVTIDWFEEGPPAQR